MTTSSHSKCKTVSQMRLWRFESTGGNWMIALSRCRCVFSPSVDAGVLYVSLRGGEGSLGGLCQWQQGEEAPAGK